MEASAIVEVRDESDYADDLEQLLAACENLRAPPIDVPLSIFEGDNDDDRSTTSTTTENTIEYVTLDTPHQLQDASIRYSPISSTGDDAIIMPMEQEPPLPHPVPPFAA